MNCNNSKENYWSLWRKADKNLISEFYHYNFDVVF